MTQHNAGAVTGKIGQGRTILAIGVFDLFHVGHLRYLKRARSLGNRLKVAVAPDHFCVRSKGAPPAIPEDQRVEILRGLGWLDHVDLIPHTLDDADQAVGWITDWQIDHVAVGGNWQATPRWRALKPALALRGISTSFLPVTEEISSTMIKARIRG